MASINTVITISLIATMPIVLFVEKNGTIKEMKLKDVQPEELYRKASFKTAEGFGVQTTWSKMGAGAGAYNVCLYARKSGRPGSENKYDFPPPVDSELFFGGCILTNQDANGKYIDLTKQVWDRIYEELFGGFEVLGSEDSDESSEEEDKDVPRTKEGYVKDGFIVDADEAEEVESETSEESDSESSGSELEEDDDVDTDDLCEEDGDDEDVSDSEVEVEDEDEDEDDDGGDLYDSDGDGPKQKKKKPAKKVVPKSAAKKGGKVGGGGGGVVAPQNTVKRRAPAGGGVGTRSKAGKKTVTEPVENGNGYLNCSDELVEEAYLE